MNQPLPAHNVMDVVLEYTSTTTGQKEVACIPITVVRPAMSLIEKIPISLDQHINRYSTATTINEAVALAKKFEFAEAQRMLNSLVSKIQKSASGREPYCQDLMKDIQECVKGMSDSASFQTGIHCAHAYSSMYFMERSAGLKQRALRHNSPSFVRHVSYGYSTPIQETEAENAANQAATYVNMYCPCKA